jgi:hypothetical protein
MSSIYVSKPHMRKVRHIYGARVPRMEHCIHVDGRTGRECGQPTVDGAQRCPACADRLKTAWSGPRYNWSKVF